MSDFSSLELDQPQDQSSVTDTLRQPIWIALITSLGIHAALGINFSKLSWFSEEAKLPPTVGLIELTPELLERLPQPEEPEIAFSTTPTTPNTPNLSPVAPPPTGELPSLPESSSSELPEIPIDPSDYELPELQPEDSISFSSSSSSDSDAPSNSTPSVSRLPQNQSTVDDYSYNYPSTYPSTYPSVPGRSPLPTTPTYSPPLPNISPQPVPDITPQPVDIFQAEPPQEPNQEQIDEFELRKNLNLTDKVYESGLSRRQTIEIEPREETGTVENSTQSRGSYSENLRLPPRRYQDKEQNQIAITPNDSYTQIEETPVATATPETPPQPDPTKINRLPEAPIVRQLREGKTIQEIAEEAKQPENVAVANPPEIESQETPSPAPTPEQQTKIKGSLLKKFENSQQQQVTETTPDPKPSPQPEENVAAATVEETQPPTPEVKETPSVAPAPESSPPVQQQEEFRGSLLQKFKEQKEQNAAVAEESQSREIALGAVGAYMEWAVALGLEEESLTQSQAISDVYPEAACERKLEGNASVGVLVSPDGAIESGPKLLLESGYAVLDEAALDAVSQRSFSASDRSKLYQYEFSFDSSNCSAAQPTEKEIAPTQGAESEETAQPTGEAIPIEVVPPEGE